MVESWNVFTKAWSYLQKYKCISKENPFDAQDSAYPGQNNITTLQQIDNSNSTRGAKRRINNDSLLMNYFKNYLTKVNASTTSSLPVFEDFLESNGLDKNFRSNSINTKRRSKKGNVLSKSFKNIKNKRHKQLQIKEKNDSWEAKNNKEVEYSLQLVTEKDSLESYRMTDSSKYKNYKKSLRESENKDDDYHSKTSNFDAGKDPWLPNDDTRDEYQQHLEDIYQSDSPHVTPSKMEDENFHQSPSGR